MLFMYRLIAGGVVVHSETAAALRSLFHSIHDTDNNTEDEIDDDEHSSGGGSDNDHRGGSSSHHNNHSSSTTLNSSGRSLLRGHSSSRVAHDHNLVDSMDLDVNRGAVDTENAWNEYGAGSSTFPSHSSAGVSSTSMNFGSSGGGSASKVSGLPAHLRPPSIDTTVRDEDPNQRLLAAAGIDMSAQRLIDMLHQLKSTPSPHAENKNKRQRKGNFYLLKLFILLLI